MERSEHATARKPITALIVAAWAVLVLYVALIILLVGSGIAHGVDQGGEYTFGYAIVLALPLCIMVPVLTIGTIRRNRVGPWVCIVLGVVTLSLLILLLTS